MDGVQLEVNDVPLALDDARLVDGDVQLVTGGCHLRFHSADFGHCDGGDGDGDGDFDRSDCPGCSGCFGLQKPVGLVTRSSEVS